MIKDSPLLSGEVELFAVRNGEKRILQAKSANTVVYSGADIIANAMIGKEGINGAYFLYTTDTNYTLNNLSRESNATIFTSKSAPYGLVRAGVMVSKDLGISDGHYKGNCITYIAETGSTFEANAKLLMIGLFSTPKDGLASQDILYSYKVLDTPKALINGERFSFNWTVKFT